MSIKTILLLVTVCIAHKSIYCQSTVTLRRSFIDSLKNRVTISSQYDVWFTHHNAKPAADDGDIHFSGYDKKIGMPTVAELMNAKNERDAIDIIIAHEGKGEPNNPKLNITGVWRFWPEHMGPAGTVFFQGMKLTKTKIKQKTTNPDHVFEIHPIVKIENLDLVHSLKNIEGYEPKLGKHSFDNIRAKAFTISSTKKNISFTTKQIGFNYIDLWIRIDSLWEVEDGAFAFCRVLDSNFDPVNGNINSKTISTKTRVVFAKDSEAYIKATQSDLGSFIHILGTPRINLAILSWREWVSKDRPEVLTWRLPFEIIADGIIE